MKSIYIAVMALALAIQTAAAQQTGSRNYIISRSFKQAGADADDVSKVRTQVQYFDGLGRALQTVAVGVNPDGNDLVEHIAYDEAGRQIKSFLPYVVANGKGAYQSSAATATDAWYVANTAALQADGLGRAYSETGYERSPLSRTTSSRQPGNKSKPGTVKYLVNGPNEVPMYDYTPSVNSFSAIGSYAEGSLLRIQTIDEQGHESNEYVDMLGQTVCRTQLTGTETLQTNYIYDDYGQLRVVLQPKYQTEAVIGNTFTYNYDDKGRLVEKWVSGVLHEFVYDKYFRQVLSRDANQKNNNTWVFTKYDAQNRAILTGELTGASSVLRVQLQGIYDSYNAHHEASDGSAVGYTLTTTQPNVLESHLRTITYYDTYPSSSLAFNSSSAYHSQNSNVKSYLTGGKVRLLLSDGTAGNWLTSTVYYDSEYRTIQTSRELHDLGANAVERQSNQYLYNLAPVVAVTKTEQVLPGGTNTHVATFAYDHADRLLSTKEKVTSGAHTPEAFTMANRYNNLGQIKSTFQHSSDDLRYRRRTDYTNNIRGWLTDAKTAYLPVENQPELPFYTIALSYANGNDYTNGNISGMLWATKDQTTLNKGLAFEYDKANRLTEAKQPNGVSYAETETDIKYDKNGNLTSLKRYDASGEIDRLTYTNVANKLTALSDGTTSNLGVRTGSITFTYDANGNMTGDGVRNTTLTYNNLNLPATVAKSGSTFKYTYDAAGNKHKYESTDNTIKYAGIFEYRLNGTTNELYRVALSNGQAVFRNNVLNFEYYTTDHLGNVRLVFDDKGGVLQTTDYYAFGLAIDRNSVPATTDALKATRNSVNRYLYNGKEIQANTDYLDYGARMYMPEIGRWGVIDPMATEIPNLSPYNFVNNNPLNRIDPDGNFDYPIITITKQKTGQRVDQRVIGYSGGKTTKVDLYKAVVTDTEDASFRMEFPVTRDAWVDPNGRGTAKNVAFEPKDGNINHFTGKVMSEGYPKDNGTEALKLTQYGSEVVHAEPNQTSVDMEYRTQEDVAKGVMIHVGGNYNLGGKNRVAASEGCFGLCNPGNSSSKQSNSYSNSVMELIQRQAAKSKTNPGKIEIIIQKRTGYEFPDNKVY